MPPIEEAAHLIRYLWEIGPAMPGGMGAAPITHQEIAAWQEMSGTPLRPWEARWLRNLSWTYVCELHKSEKPDCPAPWESEGFAQDNRGAVANSMRRAIAAMANAN